MAPGPDFTKGGRRIGSTEQIHGDSGDSKNAFSIHRGLPLVKAKLFSQAQELEFQSRWYDSRACVLTTLLYSFLKGWSSSM